MSLRKYLLSGLFSLVSGTGLVGFGTKCEAEQTSWVNGYPKVTGRTGSYAIDLSCKAKSEGQNLLSWASTTYIITGPNNYYIHPSFKEDQTIPAGQTIDSHNEILAGVSASGAYDCVAQASGTDTVTGNSWWGSTSDTYEILI